jgi:predicted ATPase
LFEAFTRALRAIARTRPLLLILEDMHWCGAASAELLGFVANRIATERIAIVATYRSEEIVRSHPLRPVRRTLQTRGAGLTIELPRLDRAAIAGSWHGWPRDSAAAPSGTQANSISGASATRSSWAN